MNLDTIFELLKSKIDMPLLKYRPSVKPEYYGWYISDFLLANPELRTTSRDKAASECKTTIDELCHQMETKGYTDLREIVSIQSEIALMKHFYEDRCSECGSTKPNHHSDYRCGQTEKLYNRRIDVITACIAEELKNHKVEPYELTFKAPDMNWHNIYHSLINDKIKCYIFQDKLFVIINELKYILHNSTLDYCNVIDFTVESIRGDLQLIVYLKLGCEMDLHMPGVVNMMVNHALDFINEEFPNDHLDMSMSYVREIKKYLEDTPLSLVSLACWQANNALLRAKSDGCYSKMVRNITKGTLRKKLKLYASNEHTVDPEKYVDYFDINDSLIEFLDKVIPPYPVSDVKVLSPIDFEATYFLEEE